MSDGFIKLSRSLLDWDWHDEPKTGYLYIIMLLLANHEETLWRGETLLRGQLLTGRRQLSIASGLTEDEVRTALGHLKKTGHAMNGRRMLWGLCVWRSAARAAPESDRYGGANGYQRQRCRCAAECAPDL